LAAVFVEGDVADPVQAIFDAPVAAVEGQELTGGGAGGIEIRDAVDALAAYDAGAWIDGVALDLPGLCDVGEIEVVVECGGGANRALFDASVGLINRGVLRGG
jgi:hypothetical protein